MSARIAKLRHERGCTGPNATVAPSDDKGADSMVICNDCCNGPTSVSDQGQRRYRKTNDLEVTDDVYATV
jgi:hypothetical protein